MPTGYTAGIEDGAIKTFPEFLWTCARAMGALIMMRDDSWDTPIPERFIPSQYQREAIEKAQLSLENWQALTMELKLAELRKAQHDEIERNKEYAKKQEVINARYATMLEEVRRWNPPTKEHEGLKGFMIEQIQSSTKYQHSYNVEPKDITEEDVHLHTATLLKDVSYYTKAFSEEIERVEARNVWLAQLRESVPMVNKNQEA